MWLKNHPNEYELSMIRKTQKYCRYISWIPWLKMVAICNSLSMYATKNTSSVILSEMKQSVAEWNWAEESIKNNNIPYKKEEFKSIGCQASSKWQKEKIGSDIDLFIITAPKRMWISRLLITWIFHILWVRRHWKKTKDRFCLSFFITENAMDLSKIAIENDIYLYYWIYYLKPIINKDKTYEKFIEANTELWINWLNLHWDNKAYIKKPIYVISREFEKSINLLMNPILNLLDLICKKIFLPKTLSHKKRLWNPWGIIVTDDMLKFTDNDKRKDIRDKLTIN